MSLDEYAAESLERMTDGGLRTSVLCRYGDRELPVHGIIQVAGEWVDMPIPVIASTDTRMVRLAKQPIDFGVHG